MEYDVSEKSAYDSLTPKQEAFCLAYIESGNSSDAYRKAYNAGKMTAKTINEKASRLLAEGKVRARVEELRKPVVEAAQITLAGHLERLEALSVAAAQAGQYSAAIVAEVSRGKVAGFYIERKEVRTGPLDDVPYEEKVKALDVVRQAIAKAKA